MKTNIIYNEDCLVGMKKLPDNSIDLIYIDPPFSTGKVYYLKNGEVAFDDRFNLNELIEFLIPRIQEIHRVLKATGSFYLHGDSRFIHYIKIECDKIFGIENFQRDIIWRMGWVSGFKTLANNWIRNHDNILYYVKDCQVNFTFNKTFIPYPEGYERWKNKKKGKGYVIEDVWGVNAGERINSLAVISFAKENCGYPTQKPKALLKRIILASSNSGDIVADFFCGSGTTLLIAKELNRKYIGCDNSKIAIKIAKNRLKKKINDN